VLAVSASGVAMSAASTTNSAEDWTPEQDGTVSDAVPAGVVSSKLKMLYSTDQLVEFQYAPNGTPSDKCLANTSAHNGVEVPTLTVVLVQCGLTAQSLWILDASSESNGYVDRTPRPRAGRPAGAPAQPAIPGQRTRNRRAACTYCSLRRPAAFR
jgi:hypothetical protein